MTAIKASDIDRFIADLTPNYPIILVYGPDAGLVRERVDVLVRASVDNPDDPFALARIDGDELAANPSHLVEEAHTVPLFGGRRAVWVRARSRNISAALEALIASPPTECRVIIEGGDLRKNAPLRMLCEKAKIAAAVPCYADNERELARLIDSELSAAELTISPKARAMLLSLLGGDRFASRNELRKLVLYALGQERIEISDIVAVVADASALAIDEVIDAAFAGNTNEVDNEFIKTSSGGSSAAAIISAALRQVATLHKMQLAIGSGASIEAAMTQVAPPIHFTRERSVRGALQIWTPARLLRVMQQLAQASLDMRRNPVLADALAHRCLLSIAVAARRQDF